MIIILELKQNKIIIISIFYGKQETKTRKQAKNEFDYLLQHLSKYLQSDNHLLLP